MTSGEPLATGPKRGAGGFRRRVYVALFAFVLIAGVGVALALAGHLERDQVITSFVRAWRVEQELDALERCLSDQAKMVTLIHDTYTEGPREGVSQEISAGFAKSSAECLTHVTSLASPELASDKREGLLTRARKLLADLQFVIDNVGVNHTEAVVRQALSAQDAEDLLGRTLPDARQAQHEKIRLLQEALASLGATADRTLLAALILPIGIFGAVAVFLLRRVMYGLGAISRGTDAFGAGDFSYRVEVKGTDEFAALGAEVNAMAARIERSQLELEARAVELERYIATLQSAQATMVEQQKLAALGELVAGLAHEVNTPIGVAVTSGSLIDEHVAALKQHAEAGTATRGILKRSVTELDEAIRPLLDNLSRAAQLVRSFRQVAVDRGDVSTRRADLYEWADSVTQSLMPMARRARVTLVNEVDLKTTFEVAAGELEQVLTNLIVNACTHAYDPPNAETDPATRPIRISARIEEDQLCLEVTDEGHGMAPEVAARVFEPFFTTRRGRGGSGLGMHIVHQLVQGRFHGTIKLDTAPQQGTRWTLRLPIDTEALHVARDEG
jgi:signal transduction histidine kinase